MLNEFIKSFTNEQIFDEKNVVNLGSEFYLVDEALKSSAARIKRQPVHIGLFIGKRARDFFVPGLWLLQRLSKSSSKRVFVDEKGAWLFICGRDISSKNIKKIEQAVIGARVLVMNEHKECIGYGELSETGIKKRFDIGNFLRRERKQ